MAVVDLTTPGWTEIVAAGGVFDQMVTIELGEALAFLGAPDLLRKAIKLGGAETRTLFAPAGVAISIYPIDVLARMSVGSAGPISNAISFFALTLGGEPLTLGGQILTLGAPA